MLSEKVKKSIERIQHYDPAWFSDNKAYYVAFSGGKDSCVIKRLMDMSGVKYDAHYRVTSVDPPELVRFIKQEHPDVHNLRAFAKMLEERRHRGRLDSTWRMGTTPEDVYHWWMEDGVLPGQEVLEDFLD